MIQKKNDVLDDAMRYLGLEGYKLTSQDLVENIKELCVARLCRAIGIDFNYDYRHDYFMLFSNVVGEAVCRSLGIGLIVGSPVVRLIRYNGVNLVDKAYEILNRFDIEEAFLDLYQFIEDYRDIVPKL